MYRLNPRIILKSHILVNIISINENKLLICETYIESFYMYKLYVMKRMEVCKKEAVGNDLHISMEVLYIKYGV